MANPFAQAIYRPEGWKCNDKPITKTNQKCILTLILLVKIDVLFYIKMTFYLKN